MAKTKKVSPEETLRALYNLQVIDSKIDKMREVRGELPLEVQGLEDELAGLSGRVEENQSDWEGVEKSISDKKNTITEAKDAIKKYADQQNKVRNNREFDSLNKEVEYQDLEMQLAEKRIKEYKFKIDSKKELLEEAKELFNQKKAALDLKKDELKEIISETEKEEDILIQESEKAGKSVEDRYLRAYKRIRGASKNGLAVVPVERGASGGSFIKIPPQMQIDIAARKKIIVDEHSGRILVDAELAVQQFEKINKKIIKLLK